MDWLQNIIDRVPATVRWFSFVFGMIVMVIMFTPLFSPVTMRLGPDAVIVRTYSAPPFLLAVPNSKTDKMSQAIQWSGLWQQEVMTTYWTLLFKKPEDFNPKENVVVDIGPQLGFFTFHAAAMGYEVYAFEVSPKLTHLFELSTHLNSFTSEEKWKVTYSHHPVGVAEEGHNPLNLVSLDEHFQGKRIRLLRISSFGSELGIFKSMETLARKGAIDYIVLQIEGSNSANCMRILKFLETHTFYVYHIYDLYSFIEIPPHEFENWVSQIKSYSQPVHILGSTTPSKIFYFN